MRQHSAQSTGAPSREALQVCGLSKWFGDELVLDDLSFGIGEGESLVILGHSGSGKTTTLRIIAGLESPDSGEIFLAGRRIEHLRARDRNVGVIFQNYALFPGMTVEENISFGLRIRGVGRAERARVAAELLVLIGLTGQSDKYPWQLSGGQQQRVAIARALAYQPALLLFDESFSALDPQTRGGLRREIRALLRRLRIPALFITHDQEEAMELGDQIAILNRGRLEQIGSPEEVYHHPRTEFVASFLGAANVLAAGPGRPGRLLFRPEEVMVVPAVETLDSPCTLGEGRVVEVGFAGAVEWLTIELENGGQSPASIRASRTRWEARQARLLAGDRVRVGLRTFQPLE